MRKKNNFEEIIQFIKKRDNFLVVSHHNPDGDALGSMLAVKFILGHLGKNFVLCNESPVPEEFRFLPMVSDIRSPQEIKDKKFSNIIVTDCGSIDRVGNNVKKLFTDDFKIVNVDHHSSNTNFGSINLVDDSAAAAVVILYRWISSMGLKIDRDLATILYTGIYTDTGRFRYNNTNKEVFEMAGHLSEIIPVSKISDKIETNTLEDILLERDVLNTMKTTENKKIVWFEIRKEIIETFGVLKIKKFIDKGLTNVSEVAVQFRERNEKIIEVSLRSKKKNIAQVAQFFGGGGHSQAAGFIIYDELEGAVQRVIRKIEEELKS